LGTLYATASAAKYTLIWFAARKNFSGVRIPGLLKMFLRVPLGGGWRDAAAWRARWSGRQAQ
jgi:hypothetical protein